MGADKFFINTDLASYRRAVVVKGMKVKQNGSKGQLVGGARRVKLRHHCQTKIYQTPHHTRIVQL